VIPERRAPRGSNPGSPYKVQPRRRAIDLKLRVRPYLNDAGVNGWELVSLTSNNKAYLKRQVAEPGAASAMPPRRKTSKTTDAG
jgi:hypothetical protein